MDENVPITSPQPTEPVPPTGDFKPILLSCLVVLILALLGGILFFDQIKSALTKQGSEKAKNEKVAQNITPQPTSLTFPTIDPRVVCARFTNLENALLNIEKACVLDLSNQNLAALPSDVTKLKNLNEISLSNNKFKTFPNQLLSLQALLSIDLSNNQISELPASISDLKDLQLLDLSNNNISKVEQEKIKAMFSSRGAGITIKF